MVSSIGKLGFLGGGPRYGGPGTSWTGLAGGPGNLGLLKLLNLLLGGLMFPLNGCCCGLLFSLFPLLVFKTLEKILPFSATPIFFCSSGS